VELAHGLAHEGIIMPPEHLAVRGGHESSWGTIPEEETGSRVESE
jgi:hypothetical protein